MIMTVAELRQHITTDMEDQGLAAILQALELQIRGYTNNQFHAKGFGRMADIVGGTVTLDQAAPFEAGDTVDIHGDRNDGLFTVKQAEGGSFTVSEKTYDEIDAFVCKVVYPMDIKMGVVNMIKWDMNNRDKVGVQSESISRHTVTYFDMQGDNSIMGYPKALTGFLKPYMRARFGQGVRV